jgi:hypothetical protein
MAPIFQSYLAPDTCSIRVIATQLLSSANHQTFPRGLDDLLAHGSHLVDRHNALNLGKQAMQQPKISIGNPNDGRNGFHIREIVNV